MALHHRREAPVRPRFLLALTLSTVTALAVGAPLAIQAIHADRERTEIAGPAASSQGLQDGNVSQPMDGRSLRSGESLVRGGVGADSESASKGKAQAMSPKSAEATIPAGTSSPSTDTTLADTTSSVAAESSTTTAASSTSSSGSTTTSSGASSSSSSSSTSTSTTAATTSSTTRPTTSSSTTTSRPASTTSSAATTPSSAPDVQASGN